jgi:hypothetical protein
LVATLPAASSTVTMTFALVLSPALRARSSALRALGLSFSLRAALRDLFGDGYELEALG